MQEFLLLRTVETARSKGSLFEKVHPFLFLKVCRAPVSVLSSVRRLFSV